MSLFTLILYFGFTEVHVPFVGDETLAAMQANAEMDHHPEIEAVVVVNSHGRVIYSIGE